MKFIPAIVAGTLAAAVVGSVAVALKPRPHQVTIATPVDTPTMLRFDDEAWANRQCKGDQDHCG